MRLSIISFTEKGVLLSRQLLEQLKKKDCMLYTKCRLCDKEAGQVQYVTCGIGEWAGEQLAERNALLFIGACGIAVRAIAPYITDKLKDSPVLVMDEKGQYVIPLLSGHVGGANELAGFIAEKMGAVPVITTATDINHQFAIDLFAEKNGLAIRNRDGIVRVSSKVLTGKSITISIETGHYEEGGRLPENVVLTEYPPTQRVDAVVTSENREFDAAIVLMPREYGIGAGCRKGREAEKIEAFFRKNLERAGISVCQILGIASIDAKKEEAGFLAWSRKEKLPFVTYTAQELMAVEGVFHTSEFVKEQVGADNVCERAALKLCEPNGRLVYEKYAEDGMTIAIARREWRVSFEEK